MIRVLRNFKLSSIANSRTRNIVLYAAGEIFFIFLGISLALWFNNRNEAAKIIALEIQILGEMRVELEVDHQDLTGNRLGHMAGLDAVETLENMFLNLKIPHDDSLYMLTSYLFRDYVFLSNTASYDYLKSKGVATISNDTLRQAITNLYDFSYEFLRKLEEDYQPMQFHRSYSSRIRTFLNPYFKYAGFRKYKVDIEYLRNHREIEMDIIHILDEIIHFRTQAIKMYSSALVEIEVIQKMIDNHLIFLRR